jgi:hypothetical protein
MDRIPPRLWRMPDRLPPPRARLLVGLAAMSLAFAVVGVVVYDGPERVAYAVMFLSVGLSNLAWAVGSLVPEERGGRSARFATLPLGILMFLAMFAWLGLSLFG